MNHIGLLSHFLALAQKQTLIWLCFLFLCEKNRIYVRMNLALVISVNICIGLKFLFLLSFAHIVNILCSS
jgi:hypothetical protein